MEVVLCCQNVRLGQYREVVHGLMLAAPWPSAMTASTVWRKDVVQTAACPFEILPLHRLSSTPFPNSTAFGNEELKISKHPPGPC
jgi:hypothetical protein